MIKVNQAEEILKPYSHNVRLLENEGILPCYRDSNGHRVFLLGDLLQFKKELSECEKAGKELARLIFVTRRKRAAEAND